MGVIQGNINQALAIGSALLSQTPMAEEQKRISGLKKEKKATEKYLKGVEDAKKTYMENSKWALEKGPFRPNTLTDELTEDKINEFTDSQISASKKLNEINRKLGNADIEAELAPSLYKLQGMVDKAELRNASKTRTAFENAKEKMIQNQRQKQVTKTIRENLVTRENLKKQNLRNDIMARQDIKGIRKGGQE